MLRHAGRLKFVLSGTPLLAGVELNDELHVHDGGDLLDGGDAGHLAGELGGVNLQPVGGGGAGGQLHEAVGQSLGASLGGHADHVAGLAGVGGDVHLLAIHGHVAVGDHLTGSGAGGGKVQAVDDVVEAELQQLQEDIAGHAAAAGGFLIVLAELAFEHAVHEAKLLLFGKHDAVVRLLLAAGAGTVLTRREGTTGESLGGTEELNAETAADLGGRTCVTSHNVLLSFLVLVKLY